MGNISEHFDRREFACPDGCGFDTVDVELPPVAENARDVIGPYTPNSACRCREYNEKVQKEVNPEYVPYSSKSKHMLAIAMDIPCKDPKALYDHLDNLYPDKYGIGLYSWGVHVDTRPERKRWGNV